MATTAPGEFSGFNHLHHHHHHHSSEQYYRHEHYHHHFHHPSYDSPFSTVSYTERVGSVTPPNAVGFHFLGRNVKTVGEKREKSEEKRPGTPNLLPPIGDALLRCDIQSDHTKKRLAPSDENAATETCAKYILQQNELHNINELGDLSRSPPALTSKDNSRKKSKSPKMSTDVREDYNVKTENDPNDLLFPFSSRGFGIFGGNGTRVSDDVTSLISAPPGTVEAFFRSETSMSSTAFQPSDRPSTASSNDAPSYVTLTPLQPLPPISTVAEKHGTGSGSNYSALDQQQQQQEQQQQQQQQQHEKMDLNGYSKLGGMGDSLPPLSNHMLLNTLAAQSRTGIQSQVAIEAANQAAAAAAAVGFSHYNNKPLSSNILPPPAPPSNPYDSHVFGRLEQCNDMTTTFPPRPVFSPRQPFAHQYASHPVSELDNSSGSITSIPRRGLRSGGCQSGGAKNRLQGQDANNEHPPAASLPDPETKITTQQLALKITQALKQHSIPQAVFAQIVLQRSQGTLSDLLRNPKPWHKLKSGKETFKRMWVWLHTNEPHRLEKLRREGKKLRVLHAFSFPVLRYACATGNDLRYELVQNTDVLPETTTEEILYKQLYTFFQNNEHEALYVVLCYMAFTHSVAEREDIYLLHLLNPTLN